MDKDEDKNKDYFEKWLDRNFEPVFFKFRYVALLAVISTLFGSVILFFLGTYEMYMLVVTFFKNHNVGAIELGFIQALDMFLFALIMMIFSMGTYDLFISKLDPAAVEGIRPDWLQFKDIDELKTSLAKVIIIILIINFFELVVTANGSLEYKFLIIPVGIILLAGGLKLLHHK